MVHKPPSRSADDARMILSRSPGLVALSLLLLAAVPAASASAKTKPKPRPVVTSVAPMTAGIGDQLTIRGKNFVLGKRRNTVLFKAPNGHVVSVKSSKSTRRVLYVVIPKGIEADMILTGGVAQPARFRLRILARRFAKSFTAVGKSPTIGPASTILGPGKVAPVPGKPAVPSDCDHDGVIDTLDGDDDNDLLSDAAEAGLKLGRCDADSDSDGVPDGYEYQSALDLNSTGGALPYPGQRPYPNPLDGSDGNTDYDGDGMSARQEHLLWKTFGNNTLVLNYSAGKKRTSLAGPNDDYRDADGDALGNWDEFNGAMQPAWWLKIFDLEKPYTEPYGGLSAVDADSDGDGLLDGADDIDHDLWTNAEEVSRNVMVRGALHRVHPFNPCLPDYNSPTCSEHPPPPLESYPPFDSYPLPASPIVMVPAP